jgi:hypothetical protein
MDEELKNLIIAAGVIVSWYFLGYVRGYKKGIKRETDE